MTELAAVLLWSTMIALVYAGGVAQGYRLGRGERGAGPPPADGP